MNDLKNSECKLSTDIVPYLYGELSPTEGSAFELHLLECVDCTDEFAAMSNARYEVYDWKKTEFEPLATPVFTIPYSEPALSWFDKVRAAFGQSWAVPGAAFAGMAIVSVFAGIVYFAGDTGSNVAQVNTNSRSVPATAAPEENERVVVAKDDVEAPAAREIQPVRPVPGSSVRKRSVRSDTKVAVPRPVEARAVSTPNRPAPTLNGFADDEDTSLRLAQLFEDIDTRD
jgi:anti-sigma factor RsiW